MLATLEPPRSLWHAAPPRQEDTERSVLMSVVAEVMDLIEQGWMRNLPQCDLDEYEPAKVRHHLGSFRELRDAANGIGSSGAEIIGSAGELDARRGLIAIYTDIKCGTDNGLADILHWRAVIKIYKRQERWDDYLKLRSTFDARSSKLLSEPSDQVLAEGACIQRIAIALGWRLHGRCKQCRQCALLDSKYCAEHQPR